MAVKALARAWRAVAGLYRVPGQDSAPTEIETGVPVQFVHDLAGQAEFSRQETFEIEFGQVAAAGATARSALTYPAIQSQAAYIAAVRRLGTQGGGTDLWCDGVEAWIDATSAIGDLTVFMVGVIQGGTNVIGDQSELLYIATSQYNANPIIVGEDRPLALGSTLLADPQSRAQVTRPFLLNPEAGTSFVNLLIAGAGGGVTIHAHLKFRLVPSGVRPNTLL